MDIIARQLGIDPLEFRRRNIIHDGDPSPMGEKWNHILMGEVMERAVKASGWQKGGAKKNRGWGMALYERGTPEGKASPAITLEGDGKVTILTGVPDVGPGYYTISQQMVCETLGLSPDRVAVSFIEWPSGIVQRLYNVAAGQFLTLIETPNTPPVAEIGVSPLTAFPGVSNLVVISPDGIGAEIVLDGSRSHDVDNDPLQYWWTEGANTIATNITAAKVLGIGSHTITLVVNDGLATGTNTATVEIVTPAQAIGIVMALVEASDLPRRRPMRDVESGGGKF